MPALDQGEPAMSHPKILEISAHVDESQGRITGTEIMEPWFLLYLSVCAANKVLLFFATKS